MGLQLFDVVLDHVQTDDVVQLFVDRCQFLCACLRSGQGNAGIAEYRNRTVIRYLQYGFRTGPDTLVQYNLAQVDIEVIEQ